jgi:hypothetical protein
MRKCELIEIGTSPNTVRCKEYRLTIGKPCAKRAISAAPKKETEDCRFERLVYGSLIKMMFPRSQGLQLIGAELVLPSQN